MVAQLALFLEVDPKSIGRIGGGKRKVTGAVDVAMLQSVVRKNSVADLVTEYGHVVVDECHHVPPDAFERVLTEVRARYVTGLTATPKRRDGRHPVIEMQLGPARYIVDPRSQAAAQAFQHRLFVRRTEFDLPQTGAGFAWNDWPSSPGSDGRNQWNAHWLSRMRTNMRHATVTLSNLRHLHRCNDSIEYHVPARPVELVRLALREHQWHEGCTSP